MNLMPVNNDDFIIIALNMYSSKGLVDINSIRWLNFKIYKSKAINYNKSINSSQEIEFNSKRNSTIDNICEVEPMVSNWRLIKENTNITLHKYNALILSNFFIIEELYEDNIELNTLKIILKAKKEGKMNRRIT